MGNRSRVEMEGSGDVVRDLLVYMCISGYVFDIPNAPPPTGWMYWEALSLHYISHLASILDSRDVAVCHSAPVSRAVA